MLGKANSLLKILTYVGMVEESKEGHSGSK